MIIKQLLLSMNLCKDIMDYNGLYYVATAQQMAKLTCKIVSVSSWQMIPGQTKGSCSMFSN